MATYTINPPHTGTLASLVAGNNSIGTVFTSGTTPDRILYIKGPTGIQTNYYWHKSTNIFSLLHTQFHTLGTIDVLLDLAGAQLLSTYLTTLAVTYKGLCVVAQGSSYRFLPVGTPEDYLEDLSYLDNPLYCSLNTTATSPNRFVSELGNDMLYSGVVPDSRGMSYPYEYTSGLFNGTGNVSSNEANLIGVDLTETFSFGCIARRTGGGQDLAAQATLVAQTPANTVLFGSFAGSDKWIGGVLAPNGKIYGIPSSSTQILEIDPVTQTTVLFGSLAGSNKWYGGVLAPNGKIYGIPRDSTQVLEIDPVTQTTTLFGSFAGTNKWLGVVLAPNGKIYGIPFDSTQILEIDPVTQTTVLFGSLAGTFKWHGGVLAPNGKIYGIPYNSTQILEIDPVTQTTVLFGSFAGTAKWIGGVLAPNGKIYGIPSSSTQILEIDPVTQTTVLFGSFAGSNKWIGGVLAPNGKIYGGPLDSTQVLEIDPVTQTTVLFGSLAGVAKWSGIVLVPNGKIYGIPLSSTQVLSFPPSDTFFTTSSFIWKLHVNPSHFLTVTLNNTTAYATPFKWNINEQHHVVMVINSTSLSIYVDGNPTSVSNVTIPALVGTDALSIGASWQGEIQHVYRVNVLTAQQVKMLDWYFMQHPSMVGGISSVESTDGILMYKVNELPSQIEPSAVYYTIVEENNTRQVKQYVTDGIARQVLPVT